MEYQSEEEPIVVSTPHGKAKVHLTEEGATVELSEGRVIHVPAKADKDR